MNENIFLYIECIKNKNKLKPNEVNALLADLIMCYLSKTSSELMPYLVHGDIEGFKEKVSEMEEVAERVKKGNFTPNN